MPSCPPRGCTSGQRRHWRRSVPGWNVPPTAEIRLDHRWDDLSRLTGLPHRLVEPEIVVIDLPRHRRPAHEALPAVLSVDHHRDLRMVGGRPGHPSTFRGSGARLGRPGLAGNGDRPTGALRHLPADPFLET